MKLKYEMEILEIDGSPMAVPIGGDDDFHGVLFMNDTTRNILELLKNDLTEEEIINELKKIYDSSEETIQRNVQKVLDILKENKLLIE